MRALTLVLLFLSFSFAADFGRSVLEIERVWEITSDGPYEFIGVLAVNDSAQQVVSITTEPEAGIIAIGDNLFVRHQGNGSGLLRANAVVSVEYHPGIYADSPLPLSALPAEGLTAADRGIEAKARSLAGDESVLYAIRDIVNWVHSSIDYDLDYFGRVSPASDVFRDRRGVCVEYSHLAISMFRSLGLESRYVSGYVLEDGWQPHAWVEVQVPGHGWVAVDPTFGQAGVLDNTHFAMHKGEEHGQAYDMLVSERGGADLSVEDSLWMLSGSRNPRDAAISIDMDDEAFFIEVWLENTGPGYLFGSYRFAPEKDEMPPVVLLAPYEKAMTRHALDRSLFRDGFAYEIRASASFNDASESRVFSIGREADGAASVPDSHYAFILVVVVIILLAALAGKR